MKNKRRRFSKEFKREALRLVSEEGIPMRQVAEDIGITHSMLSEWKAAMNKLDPEKEALREEVKQLRKDLKRAEMEREILKKATAFFAKENE